MIYFLLYYVFFRIGLFTFGGGYAMIPLIQDQVLGQGWGTMSSLIDFIAISESTPGTFALNVATFIGYDVGGVFGSVMSTFGVVTPSFVIIILIAKHFHKVRNSAYMQSVLNGLRPAAVGMIASASLSVLLYAFFGAKTVFGITIKSVDLKAVLIFLFILLLSFFMKKTHPIFLIIISMILGIVIYGFIT